MQLQENFTFQPSVNKMGGAFFWGDADSMMFPEEADKEHHVFLELECYIALYKYLSWSIFNFGSIAANAMSRINYHVYASIQGKLESIWVILNDDRMDDAYALLKDYYDSIIMNIYSNLYLNDNLGREDFIVAKMKKWLNGNQPLPKSSIMSNYIRSSKRVAAVNHLLYADDRYGEIGERCNGHNSFSSNTFLKDKETCAEKRFQRLNAFSVDARDVFILHLAYLFFLNDHDLTSSGYPDSFTREVQSDPDSDYWVTPFVQELFDDVVARHRPDIAATIKTHTHMQLF